MKTLLFALTLALIMTFAAVSSICGIGIMVYDVYSSGNNFMQGFTIFSLGSILFLVGITSYIVTKILTNTEILADVMTKFVENELRKEENPINPMESIFGNMFKSNLPGLPGQITVKTAHLDKNGNLIETGEEKFSSTKDFINHRNEILARAFGSTQEQHKKKFEDMDLEELRNEEKNAVDAQSFELAAALRDLINEKEKKKN